MSQETGGSDCETKPAGSKNNRKAVTTIRKYILSGPRHPKLRSNNQETNLHYC